MADVGDDWNDDDPNRQVDMTRISARVHPGDLLRDCIEGSASTVSGTAQRLGVSRSTLNRVLVRQRSMTPRMALALEGLGWSTARQWMTLQILHDLAKARLGEDAA